MQRRGGVIGRQRARRRRRSGREATAAAAAPRIGGLTSPNPSSSHTFSPHTNYAQQLLAGGDLPAADLEALTKKRKMLAFTTWKTFRADKGPKFALERKKQATELTADMLAK